MHICFVQMFNRREFICTNHYQQMICANVFHEKIGLSSHDVALLCDNYGIMIRSGFHCAQPLHQVLRLQSSARVSFYIYNTQKEIDRFVEVLKEIERL